MIAINKNDRHHKNKKLLCELEQSHNCAVEAKIPWTTVWKLFCEHPWFVQRLNSSAKRLTRNYNLPLRSDEDVKQEALLLFARSLQRDTSLGYDESYGNYGAFLTTIIHRCCQKALRQFSRFSTQMIDDNFTHPAVEQTTDTWEHIDLHDRLQLLPEPYKMTVTMICSGNSISEIAHKTNRSTRTVYRWLETATNLLREAWQLENEV